MFKKFLEKKESKTGFETTTCGHLIAVPLSWTTYARLQLFGKFGFLASWTKPEERKKLTLLNWKSGFKFFSSRKLIIVIFCQINSKKKAKEVCSILQLLLVGNKSVRFLMDSKNLSTYFRETYNQLPKERSLQLNTCIRAKLLQFQQGKEVTSYNIISASFPRSTGLWLKPENNFFKSPL